ncbi:MAG: multiheme c-type cytochrome, partial [Terriglobia bacterium]
TESKQMVDKHKNSVDDLAGSDDAKKYAELSGIGSANMLKGNSKCMDCHGTIISGKETAEAEEGVSCESCHGPGSGYKDPHSEGPKGGPGIVREGYTKSLALGLKALKDYNVRATACVRCHLTTDQKILASGHPDGGKFNYVSGMKSVAKHWKRPAGSDDLAKTPFDNARSAKGPLPKITAPKAAAVPREAAPQEMQAAPQPRAETPVRRPPPIPKQPPPDPYANPVSVGAVELPPFPSVTDSIPVDQALLILKKRLELLYKKVQR